MTKRATYLGRVAFAMLAIHLVCPARAVAEPVLDRVLSAVDVVEEKSCAIVRIGFNLRVRYISHFPLRNGTEVRIAFDALDPAAAKSEILTRRESLRAPASTLAAIRAIEFEAEKGLGLSVLVSFRNAVRFDVAQGADFESLVVAVSPVGKSARCRPAFPDAATGWSTKVAAEEPTTAPGGPATDADRKAAAKALAAAQAAMTKGDFAAAIRQSTKVLSYPENKLSAPALELLGLARQRAGQIAHAKAEYEQYLRRYPKGDGTARVRKRLAALEGEAAPRTTGASGRRAERATEPDGSWSLSGSVSQYYVRDEGLRTFEDPSLPPKSDKDKNDHDVFQNELLNGLDVSGKWRTGQTRSEFKFAGALTNGFDGEDDDIGSVASLYLDTVFDDWDVSTRLGRQSRNTGGIAGRFDGGLVSWQATEFVRLNAVAGSPVALRRDLPFENDAVFYGFSADIGPFLDGFDASVYGIDQRSGGLVDRQAVGAELRYSADDRSAFATLDYDVNFNAVNLALLTASWTAPDKSTFSASADYRSSPFLLTSNALNGQLVASLADLRDIYSDSEIEQLALDRTASISTFSAGFSRPLDETFQINLDATVADMSATTASGGVPATPSTGLEYYYSALLIGTGILKDTDTYTVGLRYADRQASDTYVLDLAARFPLTRELRLSPRLKLGYRQGETDDWTEQSIAPSLRVNYDWGGDLDLELEGGAKWTSREQGLSTSEELEYFVLVGYRYDFDAEGLGVAQ